MMNYFSPWTNSSGFKPGAGQPMKIEPPIRQMSSRSPYGGHVGEISPFQREILSGMGDIPHSNTQRALEMDAINQMKNEDDRRTLYRRGQTAQIDASMLEARTQAAQQSAAIKQAYQQAILESLFGGLTKLFAPFAASTQGNSASSLMSGLMDTDITANNNQMNPIGGVYSRYVRPASNRYTGAA